MKVEIKITSDQVFYLEKKLQSIALISAVQFVNLDRKKRNENSLLLDCYDKIEAKSKAISRKPTIFDTKKKYSISLKYHEASILNALCCSLKELEQKESHYYVLANAIYLLIDKKL